MKWADNQDLQALAAVTPEPITISDGILRGPRQGRFEPLSRAKRGPHTGFACGTNCVTCCTAAQAEHMAEEHRRGHTKGPGPQPRMKEWPKPGTSQQEALDAYFMKLDAQECEAMHGGKKVHWPTRVVDVTESARVDAAPKYFGKTLTKRERDKKLEASLAAYYLQLAIEDRAGTVDRAMALTRDILKLDLGNGRRVVVKGDKEI